MELKVVIHRKSLGRERVDHETFTEEHLKEYAQLFVDSWTMDDWDVTDIEIEAFLP